MPKLILGVVLALAVAVLGLAGSASASKGAASAVQPRPVTFPDATGDASGGLDIASVTVTGDPNTGSMTLAVAVPGYQPPVVDGQTRVVLAWLDTDKNTATGSSASGSEYSFQYYDDPSDSEHWWDAGRWNGSGWDSLPDTQSLDFQRSAGVVTWSFAPPDIGGATSFSFYVDTRVLDAGGNTVATDLAPDMGKYAYDINAARTMMLFVSPTIGNAKLVPARPIAGKRVAVSFPVRWTKDGKPIAIAGGTMTCDPSIAGKIIPHAESFTGGLARLSFVVPKTAKGKTLKVKVTIAGGSATGDDTPVVHIDLATGLISIAATTYSGASTTKIVNFQVH
jgi:hypothetical protein